jgi:hypothetical protein
MAGEAWLELSVSTGIYSSSYEQFFLLAYNAVSTNFSKEHVASIFRVEQ